MSDDACREGRSGLQGAAFPPGAQSQVQAAPDEGAASPCSDGWVVARQNGFGAWYILSKSVHSSERSAHREVLDDRCEVVVPWQGTQRATLEYRSAHALTPKGRLP